MDIVPKNVKIILANSEQTGNQIGKPFLWVNTDFNCQNYTLVFEFFPLVTPWKLCMKKSFLKEL